MKTFTDRYRCPGCRGRLDTGTYDIFQCPRCGDEWDPATLATATDEGEITVGDGDTVAFDRRRQHLVGTVVKVNRRSLIVTITDVGFGPGVGGGPTVKVPAERVLHVRHEGIEEAA